jgi:hypothetical protein
MEAISVEQTVEQTFGVDVGGGDLVNGDLVKIDEGGQGSSVGVGVAAISSKVSGGDLVKMDEGDGGDLVKPSRDRNREIRELRELREYKGGKSSFSFIIARPMNK